MYVGPNHPIFGGRFGDPPIGGGPENLPRYLNKVNIDPVE